MEAVLLVLGVGWFVFIDRIVAFIAWSYGYDARSGRSC